MNLRRAMQHQLGPCIGALRPPATACSGRSLLSLFPALCVFPAETCSTRRTSPPHRSDRPLPVPAPAQAATLVSHLVGVGKEHGATIEHVTPNSVALHWGVSGSRANATLRATRAAMEMAADRSHLLPQLAPVFRLQIGIGVGATNTATLSAASHCFFVTDGVEVTSTVAFVQQNVPASVECQILMSHGAYQEVCAGPGCARRAGGFRNGSSRRLLVVGTAVASACQMAGGQSEADGSDWGGMKCRLKRGKGGGLALPFFQTHAASRPWPEGTLVFRRLF